MTKKILIFTTLFLFIILNFSLATEQIQMNLLTNNTNSSSNENIVLDNNTNTDNTIFNPSALNENTENEIDDNATDEDTELTSTTNSATISSMNSTDDSGLGVETILNIALIVVGILLVLLSIAILIRLKN